MKLNSKKAAPAAAAKAAPAKAVKAAAPAKAAAVVEGVDRVEMLSLDSFFPHPDMTYRPVDKPWVGQLAESILANGLDTPLLIWDGGEADLEVSHKGKNLPARFVVAGMHRMKALQFLRKEDPKKFDKLFPDGLIPCRVRSGDMTDAISMQLRENLDRKGATASDVLPQLNALSETHGLKQKQIAKKIGMSEGWVSTMLDIKETLGKEALDEVVSGGVLLSDVREAASTVKKAAKAGSPVSPKDALDKAKAKSAAKKAKNKTREDKRPSLVELASRYRALPKLAVAAKVTILEGMIAYALKESDELPEELAAE